MMSQAAVNGGLGILVEASINKDKTSGQIGAKILLKATPLQISTAREFCRIKYKYTDKAISMAISGE